MGTSRSSELSTLTRIVVALAILLTAVGLAWRGVGVQDLERIWHDLVRRPDGPMSFRFILQPVMSCIAAILDGRRDAHAGRSPYLLTVLGDRQERMGRLREGLNATARVLFLGIVMDLVYQAVVLDSFYPFESVLVATILGFLPYLFARGAVARLLRWRRPGAGAPP